MTDRYTVLNSDQVQLCRDCGIDPTGMVVILENENVLALLHHKTRNEVSIGKGEAQRRKEAQKW